MKEYQQLTLEDYQKVTFRNSIREMIAKQKERERAQILEKERRNAIFAKVTLEVVAHHYGVSVEDITSKSRSKKDTQPRKTAQYIIFKGTDYSFKEISARVGKTDHTTAMNAIERVQNRLEFDEEFKGRVEELQQEIKKQTALHFYVPLNSNRPQREA